MAHVQAAEGKAGCGEATSNSRMYILHAHLQANVWLQDIVAELALLDPLSLG